MCEAGALQKREAPAAPKLSSKPEDMRGDVLSKLDKLGGGQEKSSGWGWGVLGGSFCSGYDISGRSGELRL